MQAVILAGGLGTRLRSTVNDRPKSMALVNGKPFLEYQIELLRKNNICDVVLSTGYMGEIIENHFGTGEKFGVSVSYVREKELLGTGGAIRNAIDILDEQFFVLNGDSMFLIDFNSMVRFHHTNNADITIALAKIHDKSRFGNVVINDHYQIIQFVEKGDSSGGLINGGIYLFKRNSFKWKDLPNKFSIEKDFFSQVVAKNRVFGFVSDSYFVDIGVPEDYGKFEDDVICGRWK
ncbi:MAG: nucleotidyltransferase family protein [Nitrososphaera sp.]